MVSEPSDTFLTFQNTMSFGSFMAGAAFSSFLWGCCYASVQFMTFGSSKMLSNDSKKYVKTIMEKGQDGNVKRHVSFERVGDNADESPQTTDVAPLQEVKVKRPVKSFYQNKNAVGDDDVNESQEENNQSDKAPVQGRKRPTKSFYHKKVPDGVFDDDDDVNDSQEKSNQSDSVTVGSAGGEGRSRWHWDKEKPAVETKKSDTESMRDLVTQEKLEGPVEKKGICIGNVFGMDVGGTLGKLTYFQEGEEGGADGETVIDNRNRRISLHNFKVAEELREIYDRNGEGVEKLSNEKKEALAVMLDFTNKIDSYESGAKEQHLSFYSRKFGGEFHFIHFESRNMKKVMKFIKAHGLDQYIEEVGATGGGAHKFADVWDEKLGIQMVKHEELESALVGMQFCLSDVIGECYTYKQPDRSKSDLPVIGDDKKFTISFADEEKKPEPPAFADWSRKVKRDRVQDDKTYPYLLVMIGTGVSILRVDGPRKHVRVSGSTVGGGTFYGIIRLLTDAENFEDALDLSKRGNPTKVDMMVSDIYGDNKEALEKLGLPAGIVASSFGKLVAKEDPAQGLEQADLAIAALMLVTNNIGQVAYLNAQLHQTSRIHFVGSFLNDNLISRQRLSQAIDYWSKGEMEALFMEHEGYFGAIGAFILTRELASKVEETKKEASSEAPRRGMMRGESSVYRQNKRTSVL